MYRKRMETTQDYLKYCLQVAQENGFLDLIIQNKDDQQNLTLYLDSGICYVLQLSGACIDPPSNAWVVTEILGMTLKEWLHGPGSRRNERSVPIPPFQNRVLWHWRLLKQCNISMNRT
ncbi:hypothetical protein NC652_017548 [Populus alba x Populus x berolinensis]|nr:hypothetical protein NC652_017548 [Populus alba x Populus x berolinensis]